MHPRPHLTAIGAVASLFLDLAAAANYSAWMVSSIMSRSQGIMTGSGGSSEPLQAGFVQKAFTAYVNQYPSDPTTRGVQQYIATSASSVAPYMLNATRDSLTYPLDRLSNGNALFSLSEPGSASGSSSNQTLLRSAADALRQSIDLNRRNSEGGLWYYTYPNWSYLDGMYSLSPLYTLSSIAGAPNTSAIDDLQYQLDLIWNHTRNASSGLLVHGYDDSRTAVWADPVTGASPYVWDRSLGWFAMALVDTLDLLSTTSCEFPGFEARLLDMLRSLAVPIVQAADPKTGGWWQVMSEPGRAGNYIESSGSAMFVYALLKSARLGYVSGRLAHDATAVGSRAYEYLTKSFVVREANGTLGYNGTVSVCSLNSTASYEVS